MKLLLLLMLVLSTAARFEDKIPITHWADMDGEQKFILGWQALEDDIIFEVKVKTSGWVAIGISPNGDMAGSDMAIGWVNEHGKTILQDMFAGGRYLPDLDSSQDLTLLESHEVEGETIIKFLRRLKPCDRQDSYITDDAMRVLWAFGDRDPDDDMFKSSDKHANFRRGSKTMYLFAEQPNFHNEDETDIYTFDFSNNEVVVPSKDTTYWCAIRPGPKVTKKEHVVSFDVVTTDGSEFPVLHHLGIYACYDRSKNFSQYLGEEHYTGHECGSPEMPEDFASCWAIIYIWTVGSERWSMPSHVGFPIGEDDSPDYYLLETHYDNPQNFEGVIDSSSIRMFISPKPRQYDAGFFRTGLNFFGWIVPPLQDRFVVDGYCYEDCTKEWIPEGGIKLFSYIIHAHYLGRKIIVSHFRNGKELPELAREENYDFDFQINHYYKEEKALLPGDGIRTRCIMDSSERDFLTLGGISTYPDEMCLSYFWYYPKAPISDCASVPTFYTEADDSMWKQMEITPVKMTVGEGFDLQKSLENVPWVNNSKEAQIAQSVYSEGTQKSECTEVGHKYYEIHQDPNVENPTVEFLPPTDDPCVPRDHSTDSDSGSAAVISVKAVLLVALTAVIWLM